MKRKNILCVCLTMLSACAVQAGPVQHGLSIPSVTAKHVTKEKLKPFQRVARYRAFEKQYPALSAVKNKVWGATEQQSVLQRANTVHANPAQAKTKVPLLQTPTGRELWGNVVYSELWDDLKRGLYSFTASSEIDPTALWFNDDLAANGGAALVNGVYHEVNWFANGDDVYITHCSFDAETGELLSVDPLDDLSLIATETATADDGTVYGEFYNATATGYELGVIDYNTMTRTTISTLSQWYLALGITSDHVLYGVSGDGNLYKIDPTTGQETRIGATGLQLVSSSNEVFGQSGEIDYKSDIFYWAAITGTNYSALYTVDLTSGKAQEVATFPGQEQIYGLVIPKPLAEDDAPAAVDAIDLSFEGASLTGTVSFTAPSTTFAGDALTGALSYTITVDDETVATGNTTAGAQVSQQVTLNASGTHSFAVVTSNAVGSSPLTKTSQYVGYDEPFAVNDLTATANSSTGEVHLTWTAPTEGFGEGYWGDLTYDVTRYPDGVKVATGLTTTSFDETITADVLTPYTYGVTAVNGDMQSGEATSNKVVIGPALTPPYDNKFEDESSLDLLTIIDANNDGSTWGYHPDQHCAYYVYNGMNSGDDWLLSPPLKVKAGKEYTISFVASNTIEQYAERLEVKCGEGDDPTAYTETLLPTTDLTEKKEYTATIIPTHDQDIKVAFHALSDPDMFNLLLFRLTVSEGASLAAPDSVSQLKVTPGANGALNAKVSCTLPTKTIAGDALTNITKVELLRNDTVVSTLFSGLTPGGNVTFQSKVSTDGTYGYKVVAYNEKGNGRASSVQQAFVGCDLPGAVDSKSIKVVDNGTSISVSWQAVTEGKNGGYVDPAKMSYNLYDYLYYDDFFGYEYGNHLDSVCGVDHTTITTNTNEGEQKMLDVYVQPQNAKGYGAFGTASTIVVGEAYPIPFAEPFDNGTANYGLWWINVNGSSSWYVNSDVPSAEGEPGAAIFDGCGDESYMATGKIAPAGASNLKLYFSTRSDAYAHGTITVQVQKSNGEVDNLNTISFAESEESSAWQTETVDLNAYKNEPYIIVRFLGEGSGYLFIDNIQVRDVLANDLAVTMTAPESLKKGQAGKVSAKVTNYGENTATSYSVRLLDGNEVVETKDVTEALAPMASASFDFDYIASIFKEASVADLTVEVVYAQDLNQDNNKATASVSLISSTKPAPAVVTAAVNTTGAVDIDWKAPTVETSQITDGFDSYDTWSTDGFGGWTTIDADMGQCGLLFNEYDYGHQGEPFAFEIFEPNAVSSDLLETNPEFTPHSGDKYAIAVYSVLNENFADADNWLVSPSLSGEEQTISFFALNQADSENSYPETIQLLYSTTGTNPDDFTLVKTVTIESGNWTEVSFDVPEGATHFAIHHVTEEGGYMLGIDDVTFVAGAGTLTGYNIYRDGKVIATVDATTLKYTDAGGQGENSTYAVSAVYTDGESVPVIATFVPTSIEDIEALTKGQPFDVYTLDGKLVGKDLTNVKRLHQGIYIINGRKVTVK